MPSRYTAIVRFVVACAAMVVVHAGSSVDAQQERLGAPPLQPLQLGAPAQPLQALRAKEGLIEDDLPRPRLDAAEKPRDETSSNSASSGSTSPPSNLPRLPDPPPSGPLSKPRTADSSAPDASGSPKSPLVYVTPDDLSEGAQGQGEAADGSDALGTLDGSLMLADVVASVYRAYPKVAAARTEFQRTNGELISSYGFYDTKIQGYTLNEPTGFYENYRHGLSVARQTWWGGYLSAGYRIGRHDFQPWYKERETDKGGELKVAWQQALLQGRAIDPQRVAVFQASAERRSAAPRVQQTILEISRDAVTAYWKWVAEGTVLKAQLELLELAEMRNEQFEAGVKSGMFPAIDLILNQQLVAERRAKFLEVERKYQAAAFKLSLFLRDEAGQPMLPSSDWLPEHFPITDIPDRLDFQSELVAAIGRRPEFELMRLKRQQLQFDIQLANNQLLPQLDLIAEASQDMGEDASSSDDKDEFLLVLGLQGELPIQRRKPRGKLLSTNAKIAKLDQDVRLEADKVAAELRTGYATLELYAQVVEQAEISLRAAFKTLDAYRFAFTKGKVDLIYLNLIETKAYETEIKLIQSQQQWFSALAELQAAMGLDPLTQATTVDAMPESDTPGPGSISVTDLDSTNLDENGRDNDRQDQAGADNEDGNAEADDADDDEDNAAAAAAREAALEAALEGAGVE